MLPLFYPKQSMADNQNREAQPFDRARWMKVGQRVLDLKIKKKRKLKT